MPLGYQQRFKYGKVMRSTGSNGPGQAWDVSGRPLIGYDAVFTYRSGKRSKLLSDSGQSYDSLVRSGSIADQLRKRNEFLQGQIREILEPTTGSTAAFACTGDTGHPFATYKVAATMPWASVSYKDSDPTYRIDQPVVFDPTLPYPNFSDPFGVAITDSNVFTRLTYFAWPAGFPSAGTPSTQIVSNAIKNAVASGVIASANPWKPKASLAVTILELLSGDIPTVTKNLRKHLYTLQSAKRAVGSDWLNVQFGWVPLLSDIKATVEVLLKLHMLLLGSDSYRRTRAGDLGEWTRTTTSPPLSTAMLMGSPLAPGNPGSSPYWKDYQNTGRPKLTPGYLSGVGTWSRSTRITADFRFTAKYHRGARANDAERGFVERATELLGLEITPAVLWELTPWTWLLDWASNLGSLASNLSLLDWSNVLLDYAYLTFVVKTESSIIWTGPKTIAPGLTLSHGWISQGYTSEEKIREQASPYGFSVTWDGLNPFQLSILAALGMSRGR
jgi:hypothetical protein